MKTICVYAVYLSTCSVRDKLDDNVTRATTRSRFPKLVAAFNVFQHELDPQVMRKFDDVVVSIFLVIASWFYFTSNLQAFTLAVLFCRICFIFKRSNPLL